MRNAVLMLVSMLCGSVALSGCSSTEVISSSPSNVLIKSSSGDFRAAKALADAECRKYKAYAQLVLQPQPNQFSYNCVE